MSNVPSTLNLKHWLVAGACACGLPALAASAQAREAAVPNAMYVEAVQMPAWAESKSWRRAIAPGSLELANETVETGVGAGLVLSLPEGSVIRLGEKTRLGVNALQVNNENGMSQIESKLKLFQGFFRFATSAVSKVVGQRKLELQLASSTAGIRGTDFWSMTDAEHDAACIFEGHIDVDTPNQGTVTLAEPTAFWANFFDKPAEPAGKATPQQLQKFLSSTELKPGAGVATMTGKWRVISGQFSNLNAAKAQSDVLQKAGYASSLNAVGNAGKLGYEVSITRLTSPDDANAVAAKVTLISGQQAITRLDR